MTYLSFSVTLTSEKCGICWADKAQLVCEFLPYLCPEPTTPLILFSPLPWVGGSLLFFALTDYNILKQITVLNCVSLYIVFSPVHPLQLGLSFEPCGFVIAISHREFTITTGLYHSVILQAREHTVETHNYNPCSLRSGLLLPCEWRQAL